MSIVIALRLIHSFSVKSEWMIGLVIQLNLTFPKVVAVKRLLIYVEGMLCPCSILFQPV